MTDLEKKALMDLVEQHTSALAEHGDTVHVFFTKYLEDGKGETLSFETARGSFYTRFGQISEWLEIQRQYQRSWAIRKDSENTP